MGCAISNSGGEAEAPNGLIKGHAYGLLEAREIGDFKLLHLRNPWGRKEWTGAWSDGSREWRTHPEVQEALGAVAVEDGAFWMSFDDFAKIFTTLHACLVFPPKWQEQRFHGQWPESLQGNPVDCWASFPPILLQPSARTQVFVVVSQRETRDRREEADWNRYHNAIGFVVVSPKAVKTTGARLTEDVVLAKGMPFIPSREVALEQAKMLTLERGGAVVVPMTFDQPTPEAGRDFYVSVFSSRPISVSTDPTDIDREPGDFDDDEDDEFANEVEGLEEAAPPKIDKDRGAARSPTLDEVLQLCRVQGEKFLDDGPLGFPATPSSLFRDPAHPPRDHVSLDKITWARLTDMAEAPSVFVGGAQPGDMVQGALRHAWLLSALAALSTSTQTHDGEASIRSLFESPERFEECISYGVFGVRVFKEEKWRVVLVDDRVPLVDGAPHYAHCRDPNELWLPIIEKAYAKAHGCYANLNDGHLASAPTRTSHANPLFLSLVSCYCVARSV
mmetsp:Transcript_25204/g.54628  ORF Transcript_25204/g.54628 Transcript_25204/m.54628 type:complete len:503 (-) Transcript_25204:333-1841(-)